MAASRTACALLAILFPIGASGSVLESFKGPATEGDTLEFCGYAQAMTTSACVVGMNHDERLNLPRLMPDAVYGERQPDQFFRLLSYEYHVYEIDGRKALVEGFEEPGFATMLAALKADPIDAELLEAISSIEQERDHARRIGEARSLLERVSGMGPDQIAAVGDEAIDGISRLLEDPSEAMKSYAARTLGAMGARATRALPALRLALARSTPAPGSGVILPAVSAAPRIEAAIGSIEAARP